MSKPEPIAETADATRPAAWWRYPIVWMVIGGPAIVVVASFATLTLAITHPDPVYSVPADGSRAEQPAEVARNHAATPQR